MATLNDFKIINQKSKKYFDLLLNEITPKKEIKKEKDQERFGFYLFILESITGKKDFSDLLDMVTDSDFNTRLFNEKFDDLGIDAIYIDTENKRIQLFNFKFREKFGLKKSAINEAIISTKFINAIKNSNTKEINGKIQQKLEEIIKKTESKEEWGLQLFIVSNDDFTSKKNEELKNLEKIYGLEIKNIGLNDIADLISLKPQPIDAEIVLEKEAVMSFSEDSLSSSISYIVRLPLSEIIRVTSKNKELRNRFDIEDISELSRCDLDFSILFDNVRGFITKSKYNKNIIETLKKEPTKFFIYNNGLTFITSNIQTKNINADKKIKFVLKGLQVVNGGQTLRSIYSFNKENAENIEKNLSKAQVLVRIFNISNDEDLDNKIAEYTNSQNAISVIDLKSLRSEQLQIEQYLSEHDILYVRKSGDTGKDEKKYKTRISMERFGQVLSALAGRPEKTSNQKSSIFDKDYNNLFIENFKIENSVTYINKYFEIKEEYKEIDTRVSEQKIFYILYIDKNITDKTIKEVITGFENCINKFITKEELSDARKLIKNDFKKFVDENFKITHEKSQ